MQALLDTPALLKILILFASIVFMYRIKWPLWAGLAVAAAIAGPWFRATPAQTLRVAAKSTVSPDTLFLCAVVILIMAFSNLLDATGALKRIVGAVSALLGRSMHSSVALAALIGMLPMPGGAIFSAPMVEAACGEGDRTPEQKTVINYWFRHIWEYWWPLYPGVILVSRLFHTTMWVMFLMHIPLTVAAVAGGYFFVLRKAFTPEERKRGPRRTNVPALLRDAVKGGAPIIVLVAVIFGSSPILAAAGIRGLGRDYWPVILGVASGILWVVIPARLPIRDILRSAITKNQISMVLMVIGIMIFRDTLLSVDAFAGVRADMTKYHLPTLLIVTALPFIAGIVMGITVGYVGASFPLVISLMSAQVAASDARFAYMVLAYTFGYAGMMLSPVHICLIVSKDYFKADFLGIYRWLIPPSLFSIATGIALFFIYSNVLK